MAVDVTDKGRLIHTPHPVILDGQTNIQLELQPGENLESFLRRHIPEFDKAELVVSHNGVEVPREAWRDTFPYQRDIVEVRGTVGENAVYIIAMAVLMYFTFGAGGLAGGAFMGLSGGAGLAAATGAYIAGSMLINKAIAPKEMKSPGKDNAESVFSIGSARNTPRQFEPLALLFGELRITPDVISNPYTNFEGNDQFLSMVLTPGINVDRVGELYNGDTLLSTYEGVTVYHNGFSGMPSEDIPLYTDADTVQGASLETPLQWVERTTSQNTIRIQIDIEYLIYDMNSEGKPRNNMEDISIQYRPTGSSDWQAFGIYRITSNKKKTQRVTYAKDVDPGQYDVRVCRLGRDNEEGKYTVCEMNFPSMTSIQKDEAGYSGIPRIGIKIKATGQLNGALDEVRTIAYAQPVQLWNGTEWITARTRAEGLSNPGAQILHYVRGIRDDQGNLTAGMGLPDSMIDIEALKPFMLHCTENNFTYDHYIKDARSHSEVLNSIALAGFGHISWPNGRLSVVWAADDQPIDGVVNMATIKKSQFQVDYALVNLADGIEYTYYDRNTWETKTLRVPAPGVTTMLNPAQVAGEGITDEAHGAMMARYHMAQSIYQFKSIDYSTDLEHLSYRRLSKLALQHDLTQWGYGGRVMSATRVPGGVDIELDDLVPAPTASNAYVGLRIPGEDGYRVFTVQTFTGESNVLKLVGDWPSDADFPGEFPDNPAHDTLWIYDFKQTPGYTVRVVNIEPESDLKGASISVVPEDDNFWTYVKTGQYIPPDSGSLLNQRPIASNLKIDEAQHVQGNTVYSELSVTFDVTGLAAYSRVYMADENGILEQVAETTTRSATWRLEAAGVYTIVVRPYDFEGEPGVAASMQYATIGVDMPPAPFDYFDVLDMTGGVRKYQWGYFETTREPFDLAGAEIRYTPGAITSPTWESMTPIGNDGFFTGAFEAVLPEAGEWTFSCRSRNTSGTLSTHAITITRTLAPNIVEKNLQELIALQEKIDQEILERTQQNLLLAQEQAELAASIAGLEEAIGALDYDPAVTYEPGQVVRYNGRLYQATVQTLGNAPTDVNFWKDIGEYSSLADAIGGLSQQISNLTTQITNNETEISILTQNLEAVQTALNGKADAQAFSALQSTVSDIEGQVQANASAITAVQAQAGGQVNLLKNADFTANFEGWELAYNGWGAGAGWIRNWYEPYIPLGVNTMTWTMPLASPNGHAYQSDPIAVEPGRQYCASAYMAAHRTAAFLRLIFYDANGEVAAYVESPHTTALGGKLISDYERLTSFAYAPGGARTARIQVWGEGPTENNPVVFMFRPMLSIALDGQTEAAVWSTGGAEYARAVETLTAGVGVLNARHTVLLDVNGNISGTVSENNGTNSSFSVMANVFRVLTGSAASGMEWQANYIRIYGSGFQYIMGTGFGANGDLVQWFGANIGVAACTTANCVSSMTVTGQSVQRGSNANGATSITNMGISIKASNGIEVIKLALEE